METMNLSIEGASWSDGESDTTKNEKVFIPKLELIDNDNNQEENPVPIDILPDDLLERILARLPFSAIFRACSICKKWNQIVHSKRFTLADSNFLSEKTWYFMFTSSVDPMGHLYDPGLRRWYNFELPYMVRYTWNISPSRGLVCFMDDEITKEICICNPITREFKILKNPPALGFSFYSALAFSMEQSQSKYTISIIRSVQTSDDSLLWNVHIHVYKSNQKKWSAPVTKKLSGWRPGDVSIICDNVLYVLVFCTRTNNIRSSHGLITYNLGDMDTESFTGANVIPEESIIVAPCALTCGRLMNVQKQMVLVGGIGRLDRPGVIKGIGIWVLNGRSWVEISRMPPKFVQGFGELDEVFASSGGGDLVYIQSYGGTAVLVFDMETRQWFWSQRCVKHKKFPLEMFSGFCFEPRLQFL